MGLVVLVDTNSPASKQGEGGEVKVAGMTRGSPECQIVNSLTPSLVITEGP